MKRMSEQTESLLVILEEKIIEKMLNVKLWTLPKVGSEELQVRINKKERKKKCIRKLSGKKKRKKDNNRKLRNRRRGKEKKY